MFTKFKKSLIMLLMFSGLVLYTEPAYARGEGGGSRDGEMGMGHFNGDGGHGGGMSHFSGGAIWNNNFRGVGVISGGSIGVRSGGFVSSPSGMRSGGWSSGNGGSQRDMDVHESHSQGFHNDAFNRDMGGREFNGGEGHGHVGFRDFDHGHDFDHDRGHFSDQDRDFHHNHFFFNPVFDSFFFNPFFETGVFYNPCFNGYYYGSPWYGYYPYYDYYPYGYSYGTGGNSYYNTYNYYTNPIVGTENGAGAAGSTTSADNYFNEGVRMFGNGNFTFAAEKFKAAMSLVPQDKVLPFAYAQAVFASGDYVTAATAVRDAVARITPETEGIFYPRRMYSSDVVLQHQIKALAGAVQMNENNASLQLLLGYNELGIGELDKAEAALKIASTDQANGPTATALLKLVAKLRTAGAETPKAVTQKTENTAPGIPKTQNPMTETAPPAAPKAETPVY